MNTIFLLFLVKHKRRDVRGMGQKEFVRMADQEHLPSYHSFEELHVFFYITLVTHLVH